MTLVPVITLVEVPDGVGDPLNIAEQAMRQALTRRENPSDSQSWGTSVLLLNDQYVFCQFRAWGEINRFMRSGGLLFVVPSPPDWKART